MTDQTSIQKDLASCIEMLIGIRSTGLPPFTACKMCQDDAYAMQRRLAGVICAARDVLRDIATPVECESCGGDKTLLCGNCHGGGTSEQPCPMCRNSGEQVCGDCNGEGVT